MIKYEILMWAFFFVKSIPGNVGVFLRRKLIPFAKIGRNLKILEGVQFDKPSKLQIGDNVEINRGCVINSGGGISIGDDVLLGPCVTIYSQNHCYDKKNLPISAQGYFYKYTEIQENVWVGANAIILPGVTVGSGSIVGAGSVVTKNVPKNVIVAGNPAAIVKTR